MKINVEAVAKADLEAVWRAWNSPEDIQQWNAAHESWHTTRSSVDLREGGRFVSRMEAKDGSAGFDFEGTYTRIVPLQSIEYSMSDGRQVRVEFVEQPGGVLVRETFDAEAENPPERQRAGWQAILESFVRHVESKGRSSPALRESWSSSSAYERYVGRWSKAVAEPFLDWLSPPPGWEWADVGCGTGALAAAILERCSPASVSGIDSSEGFLAQARNRVVDARARFEQGDATSLPWSANVRDATVSGLVLNFVRDPEAMAREMARITRPGGLVAAYVWDYAGGMQMMRHFWDAAIAASPGDAKLDQAERFPLCQPQPLRSLYERAGLRDVQVCSIDVPTVFRDFDDYWQPFLGRTGAAPTYLASLTDEARERIRSILQSRLAKSNGPIALTARAWAVKGTV